MLPHAALIAAWGSVLHRNDSSLYPFASRAVIIRCEGRIGCNKNGTLQNLTDLHQYPYSYIHAFVFAITLLAETDAGLSSESDTFDVEMAGAIDCEVRPPVVKENFTGQMSTCRVIIFAQLNRVYAIILR